MTAYWNIMHKIDPRWVPGPGSVVPGLGNGMILLADVAINISGD
jgi:hypothetical protein